MSKDTGIIREIDKLGRIVLPIELRRSMELESGDAVEIYVEGNSVILKKYRPSCIFCGNSEEVMSYRDKNICTSCLEELKKQQNNILEK